VSVTQVTIVQDTLKTRRCLIALREVTVKQEVTLLKNATLVLIQPRKIKAPRLIVAPVTLVNIVLERWNQTRRVIAPLVIIANKAVRFQLEAPTKIVRKSVPRVISVRLEVNLKLNATKDSFNRVQGHPNVSHACLVITAMRKAWN
jgi:hypothetical protein